MSAPATPLISQYFEIKEHYPQALLFFQVGDFYELFFDDAKTAAHVLALTLTKRGKYQDEDIPLCGVPVHAVRHYVAKLVKHNYSVAICDQVSKPIAGQVVQRQVTAVMTPGTLLDEGLVDDKRSSYIMAFSQNEQGVGVAFAEISSGIVYTTKFGQDLERNLENELIKFVPDEVICLASQQASIAAVIKKNGYKIAYLDEQKFAEQCDEAYFLAQFGQATAQKFSKDFLLRAAFDTLYRYLAHQQPGVLTLLNAVHFYEPTKFLVLDAPTQRNLEILNNNKDTGSDHTLYSALDRTVTPMGARLLKKWLVRPLVDIEKIMHRQQAIETLLSNTFLLQNIRQLLKSFSDLERIVARLVLGRATHQDLLAVVRALIHMEQLHGLRPKDDEHSVLNQMMGQLYVNASLAEYLQCAFSEALGTQQLIKPGFDERLDNLRQLAEQGNEKIILFEEQEVRSTGISSLKVRYTDVFGFGIEITKTHYDKVPAQYIAQQTLSNRTRFVTQELKELEFAIISARKEVGDVEKEIYQHVIDQLCKHVAPLRASAYMLANLDVLAGLAMVAYEQQYVRPTLTTERNLMILQGRHPVVEQTNACIFIPNDTFFNDDASMHIVTGPNMGGKSTYLRQVALIAIMAHMGSFVPAQQAKIPLLDRVFTRIGSGDDLAGGKSTFWVEMEETALICRQATKNSLIILDEVGRGTSTHDGMALAAALLEYFVQVSQPLGLFATHYHELTELEKDHPRIKNYSVACRKQGDQLIFLHRLVAGVAGGSFGIEIAEKAGLPTPVISRARQVLQHHMTHEAVPAMMQPAVSMVKEPPQAPHEIISALQACDLDDLSPRQAHALIFQLKTMLRNVSR